jgi:hypothetical protein
MHLKKHILLNNAILNLKTAHQNQCIGKVIPELKLTEHNAMKTYEGVEV